jgi:hypothetical protein
MLPCDPTKDLSGVAGQGKNASSTVFNSRSLISFVTQALAIVSRSLLLISAVFSKNGIAYGDTGRFDPICLLQFSCVLLQLQNDVQMINSFASILSFVFIIRK